MKIVVELQSCLKNKSGIGIYTYELTKRLQHYKDLEVQGDVFNFFNRNSIEKDLEGLNFLINSCTLFPYGVYRRIWKYMPIRYKWLFNRNSDITHFFNFIVPPRIEGSIINTIHDLTFILYPETMDKRNLKRITQDITYSVKRSEKIVVVSESTKKDVMKYLNIPEHKIEVIYNGVNYLLFNETYSSVQKEQVMSKYNLPAEYILYMGTLEPRKNIGSIIEAFSKLKSQLDSTVKLVIAGKKGWMYESIFEQVNELRLQDQVIFTDYIDEEDKPIIYQLASTFIFPSLYEGFGIPVLEAMAASVPVITSNVSSLPEVAGDAAILISPKDTVAIADGMYKLLTDKGYADELIRKGHLQAQKFSWEASAEKLYKLYKSLM